MERAVVPFLARVSTLLRERQAMTSWNNAADTVANRGSVDRYLHRENVTRPHQHRGGTKQQSHRDAVV